MVSRRGCGDHKINNPLTTIRFIGLNRFQWVRLLKTVAVSSTALLRDPGGQAALGLALGVTAAGNLCVQVGQCFVRSLQYLLSLRFTRSLRYGLIVRIALLLQATRLALLRQMRLVLPAGETQVGIIPRIAGSVLELHAVPVILLEGIGIEGASRDEVAAAMNGGIARILLLLHGEDIEWPGLLTRRCYELWALAAWLRVDAGRVLQIVTGVRKSEGLDPSQRERDAHSANEGYFDVLRLATMLPSLVPVLHDADCRKRGRLPSPPFDDPDYASWTPRPLSPGTRSVIFLHNTYYNNIFLAAALRRRGWDALAVSIESSESGNAWLYHGEDLSLYDPDPVMFRHRLREFYRTIPERFRLVHFYGQGYMTLFPENVEASPNPEKFPWDFLELRRMGVKIAHIPSGCLDGVSQTAFRDFAGVCRRCVWELRPDMCSDEKNLAWARKIDLVCDLINSETDFPLEARAGPKYFREPLTQALDPDVWRPDIGVPPELRIQREKDELIVYHAVGNYHLRRVGDRDEKGTGAVMAAIERLQGEGLKVTLKFVTGMPSRLVRFVQAQADVVVDQLNYGRYGANACEAMMLGKPTICYMNLRQPAPLQPSRALSECPLVSATEATVYEVLKGLLLDPDRRRRIGQASRAYALKWHSADACAARYERVYDRLMAGLPPEAEEVFAEEDAAPLAQLAA
jgi:glycosyltransferase involved in cell wall biosynthesis